MATLDSLAEARQRIAAAYDPELLRAAGHRLSDLLADHLGQVSGEAHSVLNWRDPRENIATATEFLTGGNADSPSVAELTSAFCQIVECMLSRGLNLHDPRYIGHQVPASIPIAGLFDSVGSVTNQVMAIYEMGPWASSVEEALVNELGQLIGWSEGEFAGFVTHGGSLANLTALLTARNVQLEGVWEQGLAGGRPPVLVSHPETHYCISRAAGVLGLGTDHIIRAETDELRRMDPARLDATLSRLRDEGHPIMAVAACACATPIGAFDRLHDIADVCSKHNVWMHVDAAHGGAACFSRRHRHLVDGLERADSAIWDAHKMLFVPALCAFVFYRNRSHQFEAFRQEAPYLFDPSAPGLAEFDSGLKTIECTKRAAAFGLWGAWSLFGQQLFEDLVDVTFEMGRVFFEKLTAADDFDPLHEPQCNIVAFRYIPPELRQATPEEIGQFQWDLRRDLIQSGKFYIVPTSSQGTGALRVTIINPTTTPDHLDELMDTLRSMGRKLVP